MGYKVDYYALQDLMGAYNSAVSEWGKGLSSVLGKEAAIVASGNIAGNSADRMKAYLSNTYAYAGTGLSDLLNAFSTKFMLYVNAYCQQVDPAGDTAIEEAEQSELHSDLSGKRTELQKCALAAEKAAGSVADLVSLPSMDFGGPDGKIGSLLTSLDDLDNAVNGLENAHVSADFTEIDALISGLEGFFQDMMAQGEDFKTSFSAQAFGALSSLPALFLAIQNTESSLTAQSGEITLAVDNLNRLLEERSEKQQAEMERLQAEYEARQEQAKWAKIGFGILIGTVSAVAIAATGGVAAAVIVGAAAGMTKSAFNAAADEYVKYGFDTDQWDPARIGISACMGGISGAVTGLLPPGANFVAKAGVNGVTSALTTGVMETYDQYAANGKITDAKSIFVKAAGKGVSSFAGEVAGGALTENIKYFGIERLDSALDDPLNGLHSTAVFLKEGMKDLGSGVVERGVSNITGQAIDLSVDGSFVRLDEIDYEGVAKDMFSPDELVGDFVGGGLKGAAKDYVSLRTPDESGRTPIIQYKLGNTTDPETGETPIIQEALSHMVEEDEFHDVLREMEERNPSTGTGSDTYRMQESLSHIVDEDEFHGVLEGMESRNPSTGAVSSASYQDHADGDNSFSIKPDRYGNYGNALEDVGRSPENNAVMDSLEKLDGRPKDYSIFGDSPDLSENPGVWKEPGANDYESYRMQQKLQEMDTRGEDARNYEIFGDSRSFEAQRQSAVRDAWAQERLLVMQGRGTRDWSVSQQEELIRTGKVTGFEGQHMADASSYPSEANNPDNIQFLTYEEHLYGAHGGNFHNSTSGRFDPATGEMDDLNPRQIPHRETVSFELSQKFDYRQADVAEQLGSDFGYNRDSGSKNRGSKNKSK